MIELNMLLDDYFLVEILHTGHYDVPEMNQWCYNLWGKDSRFQKWWSSGTDMSWDGSKTYHKFYFKNAEDAALFKLTWHR